MMRNSRFYDELRKLSRFGGDCYRAESNDVFAFGVRRLADLFSEETGVTRCDLRQMIAEEVLHCSVRLVAETIPHTKQPNSLIQQKADKEAFRDVVDNIAAFLHSDTFADCHWSEEDMRCLHKKMVRTMCLAVWSQYGGGSKTLIAKGTVEGIEEAHYDVDDYFASYMGTTWQDCRKADYPEFCQNMRFELDENGRFKPDLMLANGNPDNPIYNEIDWTALADNEAELRKLLRTIFPYDNFENFFLVVCLKLEISQINKSKHAAGSGEIYTEVMNQQCVDYMNNISTMLSGSDGIPKELMSIIDKFNLLADRELQKIQQQNSTDSKYLEEQAKSLKREKRIAKLRATTAEKRAETYLELLNTKNIDKALLSQLKELQEELEQMKTKCEDELERVKTETRHEVFREIETKMQPPLSLLQQAGAGNFVSVLLQMSNIFTYIPEMMEIISKYYKEYYQQARGHTSQVMAVGGDRLSLFLKGEHLDEVIRLAELCKKPSDIQKHICKYIKTNKLMDRNELSSKDFIEALIPYLINFKGSIKYDNIRKVMM